jgi:hypothetical protein
VERCGLRELFDLAIRNGLRSQAVGLLVQAGVPEVKAVMIMDGVLTVAIGRSETYDVAE